MQFQIVLSTILYLALTLNVNAAEKVLCNVSSDIDTDTGKIVYEMDEDQRSIKHLFMDSYHNGARSGRIELQSEGLKDGIVLIKKDKYTVIRMHSDNYDAESGGVLYLDTLYSAISGERREYMMELAIDKTGMVLLQNQSAFTKMKFIAKRSKVLGVIGVEKVTFGNTKKNK